MSMPPTASILASLLACASLAACHAAAPPETAIPGPALPAPANGVRRTLLERRPVATLPGWETRFYLIEYPPGAAAPLHLHPTDGVGFVLDGSFESAFGTEPVTEVGAGRSFVERADAPHRIFRNPSADQPLRFLVAFTLRTQAEPFTLGAPPPLPVSASPVSASPVSASPVSASPASAPSPSH